MLPRAEPDALIPEAVPLSSPLNHIEINFWVPMEINGPPIPKSATDVKRPQKPATNPLSKEEVDIIAEPSRRDL
jgi:hypothetical protein